jgi:hypothetical protein
MNWVYHSDRHEHLALGYCVRAGSTRNESRSSVGTKKRDGPVLAGNRSVLLLVLVLLRGSLRNFFLPGKISMHEAIVTM